MAGLGQGNETWSTDYEANALSTEPLAGSKINYSEVIMFTDLLYKDFASNWPVTLFKWPDKK